MTPLEYAVATVGLGRVFLAGFTVTVVALLGLIAAQVSTGR